MIHPPRPSLPPPPRSTGLVGWLRENLFSSPLNGLATVGILYCLLALLVPLFDWAVVRADWSGDSREACSSGGACWVFVRQRLDQFMYGFYPEAGYWRINLSLGLLAGCVLWLAIPGLPGKGRIAALALLFYPVLAYFLLHGGAFGLPVIATHEWGGLTLTLVLAVVGIVAALPFGTLLALGRRSQMPVVRSFCIVYIEFWRGVPLITVLFMASVMLPLFVPAELSFDKLLRAMIGIIMFQSAYMAEVVRGGLQAIPRGQYEAAAALGLNYWKTTGLIVLPQALKIMIPGIVNTFIALFKDTSLVLIIGLFDLLGIVQASITDPDWLGYAAEGYIFVALVFWLFCFGMSRYSQYLERQLQTGPEAGR